MSSHDLEGPTVQPTEGSRRKVDERALVASLPLKPGLGTAIHLHGFTHGARPRPQVSLNGPLAGVLPCRARWDEFNCLLSGGYRAEIWAGGSAVPLQASVLRGSTQARQGLSTLASRSEVHGFCPLGLSGVRCPLSATFSCSVTASSLFSSLPPTTTI